MLGGLFRRHFDGVDPYLGAGGRLIGAVDAGEVLEGARTGLLVETLRITLLSFLDRRIDKYLLKKKRLWEQNTD